MPRPAVRRLFETEGRTGSRASQIAKTILDLVSEHNVSSEAALYRLCDLRLVDKNEVPMFRPGSAYLDFPDLLL